MFLCAVDNFLNSCNSVSSFKGIKFNIAICNISFELLYPSASSSKICIFSSLKISFTGNPFFVIIGILITIFKNVLKNI